MRKKILVFVTIVCVCGAVIAAISSSQHLRIDKEGLGQKSFCSISETIDCDVVNASSYSTLAGIPISWWGFLTYIFIAGLSLFAAVLKTEQRASASIAWFVSLGSLLYSIKMAYILINILGVVCLECIAMYIINLIIAIALFFALKIRFRDIGAFFKNYALAVFNRPSNIGFAPKIAVHTIAGIIIYAIGWLIMHNVMAQDMSDRISVNEKINAFYMQSLYAIDPDPSWPTWGNPNAKVTIIEFSDFECPFCKLASFNVLPSLREFRKDIRYMFVNFPLDSACNSSISRPMHQNACLAAYAVTCAQKKDNFWDFHDDLFKIKKLDRDKILSLVKDRNWNLADFEACIDSPDTKKIVTDQIEVARKIYINSTPSIILDGRKLRYWRDRDFLQKIVKKEIKKRK